MVNLVLSKPGLVDTALNEVVIPHQWERKSVYNAAKEYLNRNYTESDLQNEDTFWTAVERVQDYVAGYVDGPV